MTLNMISNTNVIRVGQKIKISAVPTTPTTRTYTVRAGDTLYAIAIRYNTTIARLAYLNKIFKYWSYSCRTDYSITVTQYEI